MYSGHTKSPEHESVESGYFITHEGLSGAECDRLLDVIAKSPHIHRGRAGSRHLMSQPEIRALALDPRMLDTARRALGPEAVPYRATLFEKSGTANWLVVWHQDTALPLRNRFDRPEWGPWSRKAGVIYAHAPSWALSRIVALRIHLDASTRDNGPLRVLPGTHAFGALNDTDVFALARSRAPVDCIVPRGGVMAMRPLLVHSSGKAQSDAPRRVLHIEYVDALVLESGIELDVA
jgi:ectoine hydroxylase-related dioxygenase (phytanoyl-CoA dioxygenase family)